MLRQTMLKDLPNAIFSQASADGHTPSDWLVGTTKDLFGQAPAPASLSPRQAQEMARKMLDIYGQFGLNSSVRASLTSFSVSRFPRHWF